MFQKTENIQLWANIWSDLTKLICALERLVIGQDWKEPNLTKLLSQENPQSELANQYINTINLLMDELSALPISKKQILEELSRRVELRNFHNHRLNERVHHAEFNKDSYIRENNKTKNIAEYVLNNKPDIPGSVLTPKNFQDLEKAYGKLLYFNPGVNAQAFTPLNASEAKVKFIKNNPQAWLGNASALTPFLVLYHSLSDKQASTLLNFVIKNPGLMSLIDLKIQSSEDLLKKIAFIKQNKQSLLWLFKTEKIDQIDIDQFMQIPQRNTFPRILNFIYENRRKLSSKEINFILQHHQGIITDFGNQSITEFNKSIKSFIEAVRVNPKINDHLNAQLISPGGVTQLFNHSPSKFKANLEAFDKNKEQLHHAIETKRLILREGNILLNSSPYYINSLGKLLRSESQNKSTVQRDTVASSNKYISELLVKATPQWKDDLKKAFIIKKQELQQEDDANYFRFFTRLNANNKSNKMKAIDILLKELESDSSERSKEVLSYASVLLEGRTGQLFKDYAELTPLYKDLEQHVRKGKEQEVIDIWNITRLD
ncbi:Uncharacterised protein [Legionella steigerwaltii]|uniref:Uncharacterized protein n=1 Tax=Legionella steigerwaltii TaxID=460 RepID=A0A378LDN1_9GAMM|nr:hypothetical protein [Legionella steigerwaltii]KTD71175.1 hypothetical protein Lstg_2943 [Legionella steigerwaltii]STY23879.1 Uncharacterised protein [Legionella steigerwaltii]